MAKGVVPNPDARVVGKLKRKMERRGRSPEQELPDILLNAARLTREERVARSKRFRAMTLPGVAQTDSAQLIRKDRDAQ